MRRLSNQQGFTMIEVLVAASLIAIGLLALVGSFDTARSSVTRSKSTQAASHAGEQALEEIEASGYANIAVTSAPASSTDPYNPGFNVGSGTYRWDGTNTEPIVIDPAGVSPAPTAWGNSRYGGSVYRYVTWVCDSAVAATCPPHTATSGSR